MINSAPRAIARPHVNPRTRRSGFTLIELLVVITIILIVSAVALPTVLPALQHRQVSEAARILQAALAGARDSAIRDNAPSGIRLLPDPAFPIQYTSVTLPNGTPQTQIDPTQPLAYNRIVPISPAPDYTTGAVAVYTSASQATTQWVYRTMPYLPSGAGASNVLVLEQYLSPTNEPTSWFWNIRIGDKIQINNAGPWYTVVGPMGTGSSNGNSELFVNAATYPTRTITTAAGTTTVKLAWDYLYLVNGEDDDHDGYIDDGWDGVTFNFTETERWLATYPIGVPLSTYTVQRRPVPTVNAREVTLPSGVVIDGTMLAASSIYSNASQERTRVPVGVFNQYSGMIDIMINPDGSVLPTTLYSSPSSVGMAGAFYHFWLAERSDIYAPTFTVSGTTLTPTLVSGSPFTLPMPLTAISTATSPSTANAYAGLVASNPSLPYLKGEMRIVTLFTRSGQISTNDNPTFNVNSVNQPYMEAQQGVSGGQR